MIGARLSTERTAALFRGLADPARLSCLCAVREQPRTVGEVVAETGLSQPNVSKHLACLRACGLVEGERSGRFVVYRLAGPQVERVLASVENLLQDAGTVSGSCPYCGSQAIRLRSLQREEEPWQPH
jgi:DNA-binding transcriptional ArsR family regulator